MSRITKYLALGFCLCSFSSVHAQDYSDTLVREMPPIEVDSAILPETTIEAYGRREFGYFDSVPQINTKKLEPEAFNRVREDEAYWYANLEHAPKKMETKPPVTAVKKNWIDTLFWILLVSGFVALLIWILSSSNINLFHKSAKVIEEEQQEPQENIFELNFDREIQAAVAAKNYRLAVRLMYLQVLRLLSDRGVIEYTAEKTNSDYLFHLSNTKYHKGFSKLTRSFDYVWYGKFPLSAEGFKMMQEDFFTFKKSVG